MLLNIFIYVSNLCCPTSQFIDTYDRELCKKIYELVDFAKINGIEKVDYIYNPVSPITPPPPVRPPPPARPPPIHSSTLSSDSLNSLGNDFTLKSRIDRLSKNLSMGTPSASTASTTSTSSTSTSSTNYSSSASSCSTSTSSTTSTNISSSMGSCSSASVSTSSRSTFSNESESESDINSESDNDSDSDSEDGTVIDSEDNIHTNITHSGCIIVYTHKNGTQSLYLGKNSSGKYSSIVDKVLKNKNKVKESCIVTTSKAVTAQLPQTHVIINYDTSYVDTKESHKNIRTYLIETSEKISLTELNKTINSMKEIGFKFNLDKFKRFPVEEINCNLNLLNRGILFDENGKSQKITTETKKIIMSLLEHNYL